MHRCPWKDATDWWSVARLVQSPESLLPLGTPSDPQQRLQTGGRRAAPEGPAALSFLTDNFSGAHDKAMTSSNDVTKLDTGMPGVDSFFCTMSGVPIEFTGAYAPEANSQDSDETNP